MNKVSIFACVIWLISFALSFVIPAGSPYIWLPDFLLLAGFVPLLVSYKPAWPWFVFGIGNVLIGFVLETAKHMPDNILPEYARPVQDHLIQMHVSMVWIKVGLLSIIYGLIRMLKNISIWLLKKSRKSQT
ncbi:MAG: hypothetical protein K2Y22_16495 [Candidatus Obscuribacterales bacterium]|nr:hypothetical protein [Candidatus Obscuribacterales bacterium]